MLARLRAVSEAAHGIDARTRDDDDGNVFVYDCGYRCRHSYDWPRPGVCGGLVRLGSGVESLGSALRRVRDGKKDEPLSLGDKVLVFADVVIGVSNVVIGACDVAVGACDFAQYARGVLSRLRRKASRGGVVVSIGKENNVIGGGMRSDRCRRKRIRKEGIEDVHFEDLPEDMLRTIFSKLELKETGRTSVLSSKWRRMWIICPKLRFDGSTVCGKYVLGKQQYTRKFIDNVNAVLKQQRGQVVESLEVKIEFHSMLVDHLNNWVRFVVSSSTKNIALDLAPRQIGGLNDQYKFPFELLDGETISRLQHIQLSFVSFKLPSQFSGFPNLKKLDLHLLHVTRKDLQDMLSGCSNLEWLSIVRCNLNDELKVDHPLSRLLYLHVAHCEMTNIEINAMKLKTFVYKGVQLPVDPSQAQELEVADVVLDGEITFEYALTVLPKVLPSVQNLILHAHLLLKSPWLLESSSKFSQLKHLKMLLIHSSEDMDNILSLASFLRAAPLIEGLEIHFNSSGYTDKEIFPLRNLPKCSYKHLKDICITGFKGIKGQAEFLVHTVENAPALEVLTIGVRSAQNVGTLGGSVARICLQGKISPKTKLHILSS